MQDSNVIQVVTEGPQDISFTAMAERQQQLAQALLQDPGIESLSSFIGVDGVNVTVNSGRILINLPPHDQRDESLFEVMARLRERAASVDGISAWFQPVQELTIEDRVSRTQYQFSLTSLDSDGCMSGCRRWLPHSTPVRSLARWRRICSSAVCRLTSRLTATRQRGSASM